ncbi:LuxR C-terminal-related transcriptional regulator [Amycolatopsis sp. OK19-0408]|uniref:LuxR C-terminal-related transcriptional regulator n=1 Tax=Amycolatopsis iheyensis TaxID=2945988 RepID=A0A9X2SIP7_9PSEU|nr:LuxR C-terminal-related transcriptional regulator [Amycolatopsis iheyensis]MCR6483173.1 LuxR C-terminal-related transcriptional regulator [Amycolatopsis iheyensis]
MGKAGVACGRGNLPADTTSFVGRKEDVAEVKHLLARARLVTLTGVGGVGKTRLAVQTAAGLARAFPDGVWLVELDGLQDPALVAHTVLEALGVPDETGRGAAAVLADHLRERRLLIVLDNCEHLLDACAALAHDLLRAAAGLRLLATSRERLALAGEHLWPVSPLPLPDPGRPLPAGAWLRYPAMTLFAERAAAVDPAFAVTEENQERVAAVCRLLAGIPLALELAAGRLRVLTLAELETGLADCFRLPGTAKRGGEPRHQTLLAAVDWSFALCGPAEQRLWARASVFAGSFDLAAAERVCAGDDVRDLLAALVEKSVLVREGQRFRLLEPLRQFGRDKLAESGEAAETRRRMRDHYLDLAECSERGWFGPEQTEIFRRTRLEHANLRAVLDRSLTEPGELDAGLRLASTLWYYWAGCGVFGEGRHWLDRALALAREPGASRAKALWVNGYVATLQGDHDGAITMLEECRTYARRAGDDVALAYATHRLGCNLLVGDDVGDAKTLFEEARTRYRQLGELNSNVMLADIELAVASIFLGDLDRAGELCEEACATGDAYGEQWAHAYAIYVQALVALGRGDFAGAGEHGRHCLRVKREFDDLLGIALAIEVLAWNEAAQGHWEPAATMLGSAQPIWQAVGFPMFGSRYFGAPHGECESRTREALGDAPFDAAFRRGREYGLAEAITYALGDTTPSPAPGPMRATPLTDREQEVAILIADGRSNQEIADKLVISRRTAEGHVNRILRKLGFDSRAQVAAWAAQVVRL